MAIPFPILRIAQPYVVTNEEPPEETTIAQMCASSDNTTIEKRTRWAVLELQPDNGSSTEEVFDCLWKVLGKSTRSLSVARFPDTWRALLVKTDDGKIPLGDLPLPAKACQLAGISTAGAASNKVKVQLARAWFACCHEATGNLALDPEEAADPQKVYESLPEGSTDLRMEHWEAKQLPKRDRNARQRSVVEGWGDIQALRREEERRAAKRKRERPVVFRRGDNWTDLEYPRDVPILARKSGKTYNPLTEKQETRPFTDYADDVLHMEKVLVLWGPGGRGKSQAARCVAKHLAVGHGVDRYIVVGSVDELKTAQEHFDEYVPVVLEEFGANDVSQNGGARSPNWMKNLLDVLDGGSCRVRNTNIRFHKRMPRILCINDKPEDWLHCIEGKKDSDDVPLNRRLLFVQADQLLLTPGAIAAHRADLGDVMRNFKQRKLEYNQAHELPEEPCQEPELSTTASVGGTDSPTHSSATSEDSGGPGAVAAPAQSTNAAEVVTDWPCPAL